MTTATHRDLKSSLALRLWALAMALMLSFGVSAQLASSAEAAIVAQQWLAGADADTTAAMQKQSTPVIKGTAIQTVWVQKRKSAVAGELPMWTFTAVPPAAK